MFRPWENVDVSNENNLAEKDKAPVRSSTYLALNLSSVHQYLLDKIYPSYITTKNQKANFRRQCKPFTVDESKTLFYKKKNKNKLTKQNEEKLLPVILDKKKQNELISMTHKGIQSSVESISLSAHRGRDACISLIESRMFWPNIYSDVCNFIKECDICQKVNPAILKAVPELQPVSVPTAVIKQIGIDIATLPEVNKNKYIIVAIDYFSKWSEIKAVQNKTAETVARFLFELICRHSCMSIQINDQGREFVNQVSDRLHVFTGTKQRVTSAYHPQSNGLVERQNRTIKNMILKTLYNENYVSKWPDIIDGVLFAHRTVRHESTKYSPFFLLYNREPTLPMDITLEEITSSSNDLKEDAILKEGDTNILCNEVDQNLFEKRLAQILQIKNSVFTQVANNIKKSQIKQKKAYDTRHSNKPNFKIGNLVLLRNCIRDDRKGGWSKAPFTGPYTIVKIQKNNNCILKTMKGKLIQKQHPISNLKHYSTKGSMKKLLKKKQDRYILDADKPIVAIEEPTLQISAETIQPQDNKIRNFFSDGSKFRFHPINNKWQKEQCKIMNLDYVQSDDFKTTKNSILHFPNVCASTIPDGNCFFRAISLCLTGTEVQHSEIRKLIIQFMKNHNTKVDDFSNTQNYITKSNMESDKVWATEVEMHFTAAFLNADIYSFTANQWLRFSHSLQLSTKPDYNKMAIYLNHKNSNHFEVVLKVKKIAGFDKQDDDIYLTITNY